MNTPFSAEERLFRYAKTYMAYRDFNALEIAHDIKQTTFVVTGLLDEHSNMENSQAACEEIPRSTLLFIDDEGDHYAFCRGGSPTLEAIATYVGVFLMWRCEAATVQTPCHGRDPLVVEKESVCRRN